MQKNCFLVISNSCYKRCSKHIGDWKINTCFFPGAVSPLQVCLFIFLTLILLGLAGAAVSLHIFYIRKQREYVEYMKEKEAFSSCGQTVEKMEKSEEKDKMRTYIIKARISRFR